MLHLSKKPDAFFRLFVHGALRHMLETCLRFDDDWLAKAGQGYPADARAQIHALTTALTEPPLYQLTEYHWVVLYEALYYYSYFCNEQPLETPLYKDYGIGRVDFDAVVDLFFADTDFLGHPTRGLTAAQRRMMADPLERWALGVGTKPPPPDQLTLTMCPDQWRQDFEAAEAITYASSETGEYPDVPEPKPDGCKDAVDGDASISE
jgi:hypothetical protein